MPGGKMLYAPGDSIPANNRLSGTGMARLAIDARLTGYNRPASGIEVHCKELGYLCNGSSQKVFLPTLYSSRS